MRNFKALIIAALAIVSFSIPASAQFRFGIKAGLDVNSVNVKDLGSNLDSSNRTGFTAGITTEFTVPIIGLGFDLGVMYVHRNNEVTGTDLNFNELFNNSEYRKQDYIEIPLNLKYKLELPAVGSIVAPYITTGPSVAFKCSKDAAVSVIKEKKFDAAWNLGGGVQLLKHLQVGVNYSWGLTKTAEMVVGSESVGIKNEGWKITAAYYF